MTQARKARAEDAPETESPERPAVPPQAASPRAEESGVETPEEKPASIAERLAERQEEKADLPAEEDSAEATNVAAAPPRTSARERLDVGDRSDSVPQQAVDASESEEEELRRHVAQNPVNAHAQAWVGREPNSP